MDCVGHGGCYLLPIELADLIVLANLTVLADLIELAERSPSFARVQEHGRPASCSRLICAMVHLDPDASSPPCVICDPASKCPRHRLPAAASRHLPPYLLPRRGTCHLTCCRVAALATATHLPGGQDMKRHMATAAAALGLMALVATAQASETIITTAPSPAPAVVVPPPPDTLSTTTTKKAVGPDGSLGYSQSTTYNGSAGTTSETTSTTYPAAPPPPPVTTERTTTTTQYR
jgi:hypothetical protein